MSQNIRVLVVDDSALVRDTLSHGLSMDSEIDVVGTAADPYIARDKIIELRPDVLTLDVEMPKMDGVEFLKKLMPQYPIPVVMVSALTQKGVKTTMDALEAGAIDFVTKPKADIARGLKAMLAELRQKVKTASTANVSRYRNRKIKPSNKISQYSRALARSTDKVIAIGASTGGTEAIKAVISEFPVVTPGVVIVQHMPAGFTKSFAKRMNELCVMDVKEAENGDRIMQGQILIAPGDKHMSVKRSGGIYEASVSQGEPVCGHCPSVEVLMQSVAKHVGANAIGVMLTGMGSDGADGMVEMRKAKARTIAQDEESCVVFGMPMEAYKRGGAEKLVSLDDMALTILQMM